MKKIENRVLVLGNESRSTLAVVRSLGRQGLDISLASGAAASSITSHSKYVRRNLTIPPPESDMESCIQRLCAVIEKNRFSLVIPTTDAFMIPMVHHREKIEKSTRLAVPPSRAFTAAYDKFQTAALALELGVPHSEFCEIETEADLSKIPPHWQFPLVLKPRHTKVIWANRLFHFPVKVCHSWDSLKIWASDYLATTPFMVQPFFHGTGCGVEVLCSHGEVLVSFQHRRIHEPVEGGGSSYRKSVSVNPALETCTKQIMEKLQWNGVAMVEFLVNEQSGGFSLVEINGRFWGSLPLAVHAGADFPYYLFQMMVENKTVFPTRYRYGLFSRNTSRDFWWFFANLKADRSNPYLKTVPPKRAFGEFFNILLGREKNDTLELQDPVPGLLEIRDLLQSIRRRIRKRMRRIYLPLLTTARVRTSSTANRAKKRLPDAPRVLFVCKGNICRSPFAERYFRMHASVPCESAGYYPIAGRRPPREAIVAAEDYHVDLSPHRSQVLEAEMIRRFDLIFVMDIENWIEVLELTSRAQQKVLLLSRFRKGPGPAAIRDPYGLGLDAFHSIYADIANCIGQYVRHSGKHQ